MIHWLLLSDLCKCCSEDVAADDVNGDDDHCPRK